MKRIISVIGAIFFIFYFIELSSAELIFRGYGTFTDQGVSYTEKLIYDTTLDVTWVDYVTQSYPPGGIGYNSAESWVHSLSIYYGSKDLEIFRLPKSFSSLTSELSSLYYESNKNLLSNLTTEEVADGGGCLYWLSPAYADSDISAWAFNMATGEQQGIDMLFRLYAMPVMDGDVGEVPVPAAVWLFGSGLLGLMGLRKKFRVQPR